MFVDHRIAIHELLARYGWIVDTRDWKQLTSVFTVDAVYDLSAFEGGPVLHGVKEIEAYFRKASHPLAHHITNIEILELEEGSARVRAKVIGPYRSGDVGSAEYHHRLGRCDAGWRIREGMAKPSLPPEEN